MGRRELLVMIAILLAAAPAAAQEMVQVEGETFMLHEYQDLGGIVLHTAFCSSASGSYTMDGMDVPGEWIQLEVTLPVAGCWADSIAFQGYEGIDNSVRLTVAGAGPGGEDLVSDFDYVGSGVG